ncbi:MAG: hypothetical protein J7578_23285, partial [Chitinophagaceae bacterium]|nr:hypothetical protein [Chitinophagaceae bacterium]
GIISVEPRPDSKYIFMNLIETAPHNFGAKKEYVGVPGNLVAFICKMSFELGMEGFVSFVAKSKLIDHYRTELGAERAFPNSNKMFINTENAMKLVNLYYKNLSHDKEAIP